MDKIKELGRNTLGGDTKLGSRENRSLASHSVAPTICSIGIIPAYNHDHVLGQAFSN